MDLKGQWRRLSRQFRRITVPSKRWAKRWLPPGARLVVGLVLIVGGIFGFLPVLGFWMIPLGISIAALDIRPILRWWRGKNDSKNGS